MDALPVDPQAHNHREVMEAMRQIARDYLAIGPAALRDVCYLGCPAEYYQAIAREAYRMKMEASG